MSRRVACHAALLAVVLCGSGAASRVAGAQVSLENIALHGYGGWSFGRAAANDNTNWYLFGHQRGDYSHVEYALNIAIPVTDRLTVDAQPFWHAGHHANQTSSGIDYVFAEWKFSDFARLRAGSVKHPFGIYTEVFDVGTLRPFAALPQGVYGAAGMIGKAYSGVGLTGVKYARSGWGLGYDVYGGGLETFEMDVPLQVAREGTDTSKVLNVAQTRALRDVVGGRIVIYAPVNGLSVGVSGYTGTRPLPTSEQRRNTMGAHGEYLNDRWSLRAEVSHESDPKLQSATGGYGELALRVTENWQIAGLWSTLRTDLLGAGGHVGCGADERLDPRVVQGPPLSALELRRGRRVAAVRRDRHPPVPVVVGLQRPEGVAGDLRHAAQRLEEAAEAAQRPIVRAVPAVLVGEKRLAGTRTRRDPALHDRERLEPVRIDEGDADVDPGNAGVGVSGEDEMTGVEAA